MKVHYQQIHKWLLNPFTIVLTLAIFSHNQFFVSASPTNLAPINEVDSSTLSNTKTVVKNLSIYSNKRFGFSFYYPQKEFVVTESKMTTNNLDTILANIDIWTQEHAKKIRDGVYAEGTEYPANVQITVYKNPQRLSLQKFIQQSQSFAVRSKLKNTKLAGQKAIQFQSQSLYDSQHIALINPQDANIIVITLSLTSNKNNDVKYQKIFNQVLSSLTLRR